MIEEERDDWICVVRWVQATPADGAYMWTMWLIDPSGNVRKPNLTGGVAFWKLGVYWKVWRACRKHNLRFKPWSKTWQSGSLEDEVEIEPEEDR